MLPYVWTAYALTASVFAVMIGGTLALGRNWRRRAVSRIQRANRPIIGASSNEPMVGRR